VAEFDVEMPEELRGGAYADGAVVWHTPHEFTIDFFAADGPPGDESEVIPSRVTARVRIPVTLIFDLIRELNDSMTIYERAYGEIRGIDESGSG
jgi:hypothetical protein